MQRTPRAYNLSAPAPSLDLRRRTLRARVDQRAADHAMAKAERSRFAWVQAFVGAGLACGGRLLSLLEDLDPAALPLRIRRDLVYGEHRRHRLDVYAPEDARQAPVIIFFYGGAWRTGSKAWFEFVGRALAQKGFVVVIGDQRLAPEVRFPDFLHDCAGICAWTKRNAHDHGADPERILLMGHSAGAYNAIMLALDHTYLDEFSIKTSDLRGVIGLSGPYDFYPFPLRLCEEIFGAAADPQSTQPVALAHADTPPMLLASGRADVHVPCENSISLAETMEAVGGYCRLMLYPNSSHLDTLVGFSRRMCAKPAVTLDCLQFAAEVGVRPNDAPPREICALPTLKRA